VVRLLAGVAGNSGAVCMFRVKGGCDQADDLVARYN